MRILTVVHQADAGPGVFAERAAELGHELVEWRPDLASEPPLADPDAVLVLGGGMHPDQEDRHPWLRAEKALVRGWLAERRPLLGVCLGAELVGEAAGVPARRMDRAEVGWHVVELAEAAAGDPLFAEIPTSFKAFQWHSFMTPLPAGATRLAGAGERADAFRLDEAWAIQFHAEVTAEIAGGWIDRYREDPDAVAAGLDPEPLKRETAARIGEWNEIGRRLFAAFCQHADAPRFTRADTG